MVGVKYGPSGGRGRTELGESRVEIGIEFLGSWGRVGAEFRESWEKWWGGVAGSKKKAYLCALFGRSAKRGRNAKRRQDCLLCHCVAREMKEIKEEDSMGSFLSRERCEWKMIVSYAASGKKKGRKLTKAASFFSIFRERSEWGI